MLLRALSRATPSALLEMVVNGSAALQHSLSTTTERSLGASCSRSTRAFGRQLAPCVPAAVRSTGRLPPGAAVSSSSSSSRGPRVLACSSLSYNTTQPSTAVQQHSSFADQTALPSTASSNGHGTNGSNGHNGYSGSESAASSVMRVASPVPQPSNSHASAGVLLLQQQQQQQQQPAFRPMSPSSSRRGFSSGSSSRPPPCLGLDQLHYARQHQSPKAVQRGEGLSEFAGAVPGGLQGSNGDGTASLTMQQQQQRPRDKVQQYRQQQQQARQFLQQLPVMQQPEPRFVQPSAAVAGDANAAAAAAAAAWPPVAEAAAPPRPAPAAATALGRPPVTDEELDMADRVPAGNFSLPKSMEQLPADVCLVDSPAAAAQVVDQLLNWAKNGISWTDSEGIQHHEPASNVYFACDTEVADIDVKSQSPVGHGTVICFSIYAGPWQGVSLTTAAAGDGSSNGHGSGAVVAAAATAAGAASASAGPIAGTRIWVDLTTGWAEAAKLKWEQEAAAAAAAAAQAVAEAAAAGAQLASLTAALSRSASAPAALSLSRGAAAGSGSAAQDDRQMTTEQRLQRFWSLQGHDLKEFLDRQRVVDLREVAAALSIKSTTRTRKGDLVDQLLSSSSSSSSQEPPEVMQSAAGDAAPAQGAAVSSDDTAGALLTTEAAEAAQPANTRRRRRTPTGQAATTITALNGSSSPGSGHGGGVVAAAAPQLASSLPASQDLDLISSSVSSSEAPSLSSTDSTDSNSSSTWQSSSFSNSRRRRGSTVSTGDSSLLSDRPTSLAVCALEGRGLPPPSVEDLRDDPTAQGILQEFRRFFCSDSAQKVWHNYGFDRHVLERLLGEKLRGFAGDTLHMSRLYDASRKLKGGYSLESLSGDTKLMDELAKTLGKQYFTEDASDNAKRSMKERFGVRRLKADGSGYLKVPMLPPMHVMQVDEHFRNEWIDYSALDAKATWNVHRSLKTLLSKQEAIMDVYLCDNLLQATQAPAGLQQALKQAHAAADFARVKAIEVVSAQAAGLPRQGTNNKVVMASEMHTQPAKARHKPPGKRGKTAAVAAQSMAAAAAGGGGSYTMWDLYKAYWLPFGDVLSAMESEGVRVNREHLAQQELQAHKDQEQAQQHFRSWASKYVKGAELMNVNSQVQIRQLLFPDLCAEPVKAFKAENPDYDPNARPRPRRWLDFELHGIWGMGQPGRLTADVKTDKGLAAVSGAVLWSLVGKPGAAAKALAELDAAEAAAAGDGGDNTQQQQQPQQVAASSIFDDDDDDELSTHDLHDDGDGNPTAAAAAGRGKDGARQEDEEEEVVRIVPGGDLSADQLAALQQEAASKKLGKMYVAMGGGREGLEACEALEKLIEVSAIDKLLSAFIQPLQQDDISTTHSRGAGEQPAAAAAAGAAAAAEAADPVPSVADMASSNAAGEGSSSSGVPDIHRVHCSLNLNTETGRLSARRPNLQNQPALEKDRYKVRKAFCAEPGKTLIVADYGQLELRLLAHMANCQSMIRAFELGGDFHSRTALGMYDYIQQAIDEGQCLLERDGAHKDDHTTPLLKDKFASERRKAKILNFSIAYGKTAHGLSKDWGVSLQEAEETVARWYADRPEVRRWQAEQRAYASETTWVNTMIGRRRCLYPGINSQDKWTRARAERAAINTPIQGSAADIASAAMLSIVNDKWLKDNGWKLLLQVHDEVMLEGPKESAEEALKRVVAAMENPWENLIGFKGKPLRVELSVDANIADNWYDAK